MSTWRWSSREDSTEVRRRFTASKSHVFAVTLESSPTVVVVVVVVSLVFFSASIFYPVLSDRLLYPNIFFPLFPLFNSRKQMVAFLCFPIYEPRNFQASDRRPHHPKTRLPPTPTRPSGRCSTCPFPLGATAISALC